MLIGVNPVYIERNLKKQSQFYRSGNGRKVNYNKGIRELYWIGHLVKTNPIQSQTKPICRPSAGNPKYEARNPKQEERELKDSSESKFERVCLKKQSQW